MLIVKVEPLDKYPNVPSPIVVLLSSTTSIKLLAKSCKPCVVDTREDCREAEEMYPSEPSCDITPIRFADEINPAVLNSLCNPPVVDKRFKEERNPAVLNSFWSPPVVDKRFKEERNPEVAICLSNPPVVERRLGEERNPEVAICLSNPTVVERRLGEEMKSEVAICL